MQSTGEISPRQTLITARVIWAALTMGVLMFGGVMLFLSNAAQRSPVLPEFMPLVVWAVVFGAISMGIFLRGQVFKSGWVGDSVQPAKYLTGNIIAWATCEGSALFALVMLFIDNAPMTYGPPALVALAMLVLLWPNGKAMEPAVENRVPER